MKAISLLLLPLVMVFVNPAFAGSGRNGSGGGMSQDNVTAAQQKMTNQSDQAPDPIAQPKTDAAQDQSKAEDTAKQ